ncbi:uncharacterized protein LOC141633129 [Silene latifolia]|uniref:uncharacterized protein LOC141633129 n=1 Tax=Silene latifolia TaxID=37657 RepID=UPI003D77E44D
MPDSAVASNTSTLLNPFEDPLFLANSDHAGLNFANTLFNGRNYCHWSKSMMLAMSTKHKEGFLTGMTAIPAITSSRYSLWWRCDSTVRCWLVNSMEPEFREGFMTCKTAKQLWTEVFERYGQMNGPLLFQLKKDLRNVVQDKSSVAEYFNKLKRYWDEIEEIEDFPDCTCGVLAKCTCSLLKKMLERASIEKVLTFLMGLSDSYDTLKSQILSMEPMPPINKVYSIVQQIESQKKISNVMNTTHEMSALFSNRQGAQFPNQGSYSGQQGNQSSNQQGNLKKEFKKPKADKRWCTHCVKSGHTRDTCFILHPELKAKYLARFSGNAQVHDEDEHPLAIPDMQMDIHPSSPGSSHTEHQGHFSSNSDIAQLVFQQVMQMLQNKQAASTSSADHTSASVNFAGTTLVTNAINSTCNITECDWIVDSGASDHMTAHKSYFSSLRILSKPIVVGLPDGSTKLVHSIGDIQLHPLLILHDVLFIPDFKLNLLSVGKLLSTSHMLIHFSVDSCIIQDPASKRTVAVGHREAGLYKLKFGNQQNKCFQNHSSLPEIGHCNNLANNSCAKIDLYHARLGHTSLAKMHHIKDVNCTGLRSYQCETCNLAKMHMLPFNRSVSRAQSFFDLVHVDLWGHYKTPSLTGAHYFLTIVDDYSRVTWTFLLKFKTEVSSIIKHFLQQVHTQFGKLVKVIRSDNGSEIFQETCTQLFLSRGICHQRSAPYTPQQNGRVERKHRHLIETSRALMLYAI